MGLGQTNRGTAFYTPLDLNTASDCWKNYSRRLQTLQYSNTVVIRRSLAVHISQRLGHRPARRFPAGSVYLSTQHRLYGMPARAHRSPVSARGVAVPLDRATETCAFNLLIKRTSP
jgi:hypothetical protein